MKQVMVIATQFEAFVNKYKQGGNSIPIDSGMFSKFLHSQGIVWTILERRKKTAEFDLDDNGEICLLEYLMLQHKSVILTQYFLRNGYTKEEITSELTESSGLIEDNALHITIDINEALVSELFQHPFGIDHVLDRGLLEFREIMVPRNQEINRLKAISNDPNNTRVERMKAENEMKKMLEEYQQPLRNTQVRFKASIKKVRIQQEKHFKETFETAKKELEASSMRKGTIGNLKETYLSASKSL